MGYGDGRTELSNGTQLTVNAEHELYGSALDDAHELQFGVASATQPESTLPLLLPLSVLPLLLPLPLPLLLPLLLPLPLLLAV